MAIYAIAGEKMITENDVINAVCNFLETKNYRIIQKLTTAQRGIDIIAENNIEKLFIEAKGGTSSKKITNRFGKEFNYAQIKSHVSRAVLKAMKVICQNPGLDKTVSAIAIPDTEKHRRFLNEVLPCIKQLRIRIYFVDNNLNVKEVK